MDKGMPWTMGMRMCKACEADVEWSRVSGSQSVVRPKDKRADRQARLHSPNVRSRGPHALFVQRPYARHARSDLPHWAHGLCPWSMYIMDTHACCCS